MAARPPTALEPDSLPRRREAAGREQVLLWLIRSSGVLGDVCKYWGRKCVLEDSVAFGSSAKSAFWFGGGGANISLPAAFDTMNDGPAPVPRPAVPCPPSGGHL